MQTRPAKPAPSVTCAVPAEFPSFIAGVMQYLWWCDTEPGAKFRLRIQKGEKSELLLALAGAAGIPAEIASPSTATAPAAAPFIWDSIAQLDCVTRLKESLHRPTRVYEMLRELATAHPSEATLLSELHERALQRLKLDNLIDSPRKLHRPRAPDGPSGETPARMLVAAATSGLANRLLLIAGSSRVCALTGRRLVVHWPSNDQLGCTYEHLFAHPLDMLVDDDLASLLRTDRTVKVYNAWKTAAPLYTDICEDGDPEADILLIKGWIYPKFPSEYYDPEFYRNNRAYLRELTPQPRIVSRADDFTLPSDCVGVHIRRGDTLEEFQRSSDEHFEHLMTSLVKTRPSTHFFLATDDAVTEKKFTDKFGKRMVVFSKQGGGRTTPEGMEEALVDLLLLSRTEAIIGNYFSTFSHVASSLTEIPLLIADANTSGPFLEKSLRTLTRS